MSQVLPDHIAFRLELSQILANAVAFQIRITENEAGQKMHKILAEYSLPDDLADDYAGKKQHFEGELGSVLDTLACNYQETSLSSLESFYFPSDADDVQNYGQELIDWISGIRKQLIQMKAETTRMLRDKENGSEIPKGDFLSYEQRLKKIHRSTVKLECWLKIKYKPGLLSLSNPLAALAPLPSSSKTLPDILAGRILHPKPNDGTLTERLDKIRNTLTTFQTSRSEFSSNLCQIHQKYRLESFQSPLSSQSSDAIYKALNNITSECLPRLLSTAKAGCEQVLNHNKQAFHACLEQKMHRSDMLFQVVLGVTNAALISLSEEGEILE